MSENGSKKTKSILARITAALLVVGVCAALTACGNSSKENIDPDDDEGVSVTLVESGDNAESDIDSAESAKSNSSEDKKAQSSSKNSSSEKKSESKKASESKSSSKSSASSKTSSFSGSISRGGSSSSKTVSSEEAYVAPKIYEKYDDMGRLIADTDTFDGKKAIAITFDDGPGEYTKELIEGLNERGAKATFFMVGECVDAHPDVLPLMVKGGHQLGNHTYNHINITAADRDTVDQQIKMTDDAIFNACGKRATAFRPPYGSHTDMDPIKIKKTFTLWSVDTLDWQSRNEESIKKIIRAEAKDGSIILLHDLYKTSVDAALDAIDELQAEGYIFVTVDDLLTRYGYPVSQIAYLEQEAVANTTSPHASDYWDEETSSRDDDYDEDEDTDTDTDTEYSGYDDTDYTSSAYENWYDSDDDSDDYGYYGYDDNDYGFAENSDYEPGDEDYLY